MFKSFAQKVSRKRINKKNPGDFQDLVTLRCVARMLSIHKVLETSRTNYQERIFNRISSIVCFTCLCHVYECI